MSISSSANSLALKLSDSLDWHGSLDHKFSYSQTGSHSTIKTNTSTMRLNLSTYLWRPWIATLSGGLAFSYISRENSEDTTGQNILGNARFNLFPQSRFPFRAFFSKRNTVVDGDITNQDLTVTTYGLAQSYTRGVTHLRLDYRHIIEDDEDSIILVPGSSREDTEDVLDLSMSTSMGSHTIDANSNFNYLDRPRLSASNDQTTHTIRHDYRPGSNLSVNNLFTYNDRKTELRSGANSDSELYQINSNVFWRPKSEKQLLVTGTSLLQGSGDSEDSEIGIFDSAGLSGQVSYQWSEFLNFSTQANIFKTTDRLQSVQRIGVNYSPADKPVFKFRHSYNLNLNVGNRTDDLEGGKQEIEMRAGHIFRRAFPTRIGDINMNLTQRGATLADSTGEIDRALSHTIGADWFKISGNSTNTIRVTLSDTRRYNNQRDIDEIGFQQLNAQLSRDQKFSRESSLNANITIQVNKTINDDVDREATTFSGSAAISYQHSRFLGVPRLRFQSEALFTSETIFNTANSDGLDDFDNNEVYWRNRLRYMIGLLSFRLTTNLGLNDGEVDNFVLFQVRREFGR